MEEHGYQFIIKYIMTAQSQARKIKKLLTGKLGIAISKITKELANSSKVILKRKTKTTDLKLNHEITMIEIQKCNIILNEINSQNKEQKCQ